MAFGKKTNKIKDLASKARTKAKKSKQSAVHTATGAATSAGKTAVNVAKSPVKTAAKVGRKVKATATRKSDQRAALDKRADDWIARFNAEMGWESLVAAGPPPNGPDIRDRVDQDIEALRAQVIAKQQDINDRRSELDALQADVDNLTSDDQREQRQEGIDAQAEEIAAAEADLAGEKATQLAQLILQQQVLNKADQDLQSDTNQVTQDLANLRQEYENAKPTKKRSDADRQERDRFIFAHQQTNEIVQRFAKDTFPMVLGVGSNATTHDVPVIDADRHLVLAGRLECALLKFETGQKDEAFSDLDKIRKLVLTYMTESTGRKKDASAIGEFDTSLITSNCDDCVRRIEGVEAALQGGLFDAAYREVQIQRQQLENVLEIGIGRVDTSDPQQARKDFDKTYLGPAERLCERAEKLVPYSRAILDNVEAIEKAILVLQINGFAAEATAQQNKLDGLNFSPDLALEHKTVKALRTETELLSKDKRDAQLSPDKVDETRAALASMEERLEAFFIHLGGEKTREGRNTRTDKGTGKTTNFRTLAATLQVPLKALEELDLQIQAARQLAESGSVAAAEVASEEIKSVDAFLSNVEDHTGRFAKLYEGIDRRQKQWANICEKYPYFCIADQKSITKDLEKLMESRWLRDPKVTKSELNDCISRGKDIKKEMIRLNANDKKARIVVKELEGQVKAIGKRLAKDIPDSLRNSSVALDGNYSRHVADLQGVTRSLDSYSKMGQDAAWSQIAAIQSDLGRITVALESLSKDKNAAASMSPTDSQNLMDFIASAEAGQDQHNADLKAAKPFRKAVRKLIEELALYENPMKYLKADTTELNALKQQAEALRDEIVASTEYADGLARIPALQKRASRIGQEIEAAKTFVDKDLTTMATQIQDRVVAFVRYVNGFYTQLENVDGDGELVNYDDAKIKSYLSSLAAAIPQDAVRALIAETQALSNGKEGLVARKDARKKVLGSVRRLMSIFEGFPPMQHFERQPFFDDVKEITALRVLLPRFEIKVLTAL